MLFELYERKEKRALGTPLSLLSLCWVKRNNYAVVPRTRGVPGALIGRARGTKVTIQWGGANGQPPSYWEPHDVSSPDDIRRAHVMRFPVARRLTVGPSPLYCYLCTPGSAYKSPGYTSCARNDGIVIALHPTEREQGERCA